MKNSNKLVLELESKLHELHECINEEKIDLFKIRGYTNYMNNLANAMIITKEIKLQKKKK